MESLFIDPSSLPGGRAWAAGCASIAENDYGNFTHAAYASSDAVDALHCRLSSISGFFQVLLLLIVYGLILFKASELIAYGSELLLVVPSFRHIVGSIVLPILGAVPDGAIVLFSGLGPNAQEELSVGVGALAGSTIMLLTIPWFLSILAGRVNIRADGVLTYHHRGRKLTPPNNFSLSRTGVQPESMVRISGRIMMLTAISYLVIQGAALVSGTFLKSSEDDTAIRHAAQFEHWPAFICFVVSFLFFIWYIYDQITSSSQEEKEYFDDYVNEVKQRAIRTGEISLTAAFQEIWDAANEVNETTGLVVEQRKKDRLAMLLKTFFKGYDRNNDGEVDRFELANLMQDLGEHVTGEELEDMFKSLDKNGDGRIELSEFVEYMPKFVVARARSREEVSYITTENGSREKDDASSEEDEEEEEVPEDLRDKDPKVQIRNVTRRSFLMMGLGTFLVLIFSDPMVSVLSDIGARLGIPAFYVSFVLAPLASNASELFAAYSFAKKKTRKTITISFSTLLGAAIMNNTFVLAIFMLLITLKNLAWTFTAETITIIVIELVLGFMSQKKILTLGSGLCVLALYPASLILVALLENVVGLD